MISGPLALAIQIYYIILLARVILSWMNLWRQRGFIAQIGIIVYKLTEPLLQPIRKVLSPYQGNIGIDFSPLVLYLLLGVVERILLQTLFRLGL